MHVRAPGDARSCGEFDSSRIIIRLGTNDLEQQPLLIRREINPGWSCRWMPGFHQIPTVQPDEGCVARPHQGFRGERDLRSDMIRSAAVIIRRRFTLLSAGTAHSKLPRSYFKAAASLADFAHSGAIWSDKVERQHTLAARQIGR